MTTNPNNPRDPHADIPVLIAGVPLAQARAAMILIHGRGAAAQDMLGLAVELNVPHTAYLAPQAAGHVWYPYFFREPLARNEPYLTSALNAVGRAVAYVANAGIPHDKIILLGFSQGACLALEFGARNGRRYGGLAGLSGALIGPDDLARPTPDDLRHTLDGTPVFLGCSDVDFHIPVGRVHDATTALEKLGGAVTKRIYPGMGHTINDDEIAFVRGMASALAS
jgi:predicted esterase